MMKNISSWLNPEKTEQNWITTLYWLLLFVLFWFFSLIVILEIDINFTSDWSFLLTTGIGAYFIGKTASDKENQKAMNELQAIKTTLGLRPMVARGILAISVVVIYFLTILKDFQTTNTLALFVVEDKFEAMSTLFWSVIGFYLPYFFIKRQ